MAKKLAIIGAATGQYPICLKARQLGYETHCFAWANSAVCRSIASEFHDISIMDTGVIVEICRKIGVQGVVSNASETTAAVAANIAEKLGLNTTPYKSIINIQNKEFVRQATSAIPSLSRVRYITGALSALKNALDVPFVLKPINGSGKKGIIYVDGDIDCRENADERYLAEEFIPGREFSVESVSYHSQHKVIQITEKISSGPPWLVELGHHQPVSLTEEERSDIHSVIPKILDAIGFTDGATHIEIKINDGKIYLIEVNPRGGGDFISNDLIGLSTDFDYLKAIIDIAVDDFRFTDVTDTACAGVYFLTAQTSWLLPYFDETHDWIFDKKIESHALIEARGNNDHAGYIIYKSDKRINLNMP